MNRPCAQYLVATATVLAFIVAGCSDNDIACNQTYLACTDACDPPLEEAAAAQQVCLDSCTSAKDLALLACPTEPQIDYVNCVSAALSESLACTAECIAEYTDAFQAWQACEEGCEDDYHACLEQG